MRVLENAAVGATRPDLTFILDIKPETGLLRAARRRTNTEDADAFEALDLQFHRRVRDGFLRVAKSEPERCVVINADQHETDIAAALYQACVLKLKLQETVGSSA